MKKQSAFAAETIKSQLIDFLIADLSSKPFIGNEVMYGTKRKLVDLLILDINQFTATAVEIKADHDDLRRIQEQVDESKKIFDYVVVCTTLSHMEQLKSLLQHDIGIYSVSEQNIEIVRKPTKQRKMDKAEVLFSINSNFLRKKLDATCSHINADELRKIYAKKKTSIIHDLFVDYLYSKVQPKFELFLQHRGTFTHIDDIPILSSALYIR
jgi:hypothetical protein